MSSGRGPAKALDEAYNSGAFAQNGLASEFEDIIHDSCVAFKRNLYHCTYNLSDRDFEAFQRIISPCQCLNGHKVEHMHPLLREYHAYLFALLMAKIRFWKDVDVLLLGSNYEEWKRASSENPNIRFHAVVGDYSLRDQFRRSNSVSTATADVKNENSEAAKAFLTLQNSPIFTFTKEWPVRRYHAVIAIDSLYDISPHVLMSWMSLTGTTRLYYTMHTVAEFITAPHLSVVPNFSLGLLWNHDSGRGEVSMTFRDSSEGYVHSTSTYFPWINNSLLTADKKFLYTEAIMHSTGYGLFTGFLGDLTSNYTSINKELFCANDVAYIPDMIEVFTYGYKRAKVYPVDSSKLRSLLNFLATAKNTVTSPEVVGYIRALVDPIKVGSITASKAWEYITDTPLHIIVIFCMFYNSLQRKEIGHSMKEISKLMSHVRVMGPIDAKIEDFHKLLRYHYARLMAWMGSEGPAIQILEDFVFLKPGYKLHRMLVDFHEELHKSHVDMDCVLECLKVPLNPGLSEYYSRNILNYVRLSDPINNAAFKLSQMAIMFKRYNHFVVLGTEPGGMSIYLNSVGKKVHSIFFKTMTPIFKHLAGLAKVNSNNDFTIFDSWETSKLSDVPSADFLICDLSDSSDFFSSFNRMSFERAIRYFRFGSFKAALIKIVTVEALEELELDITWKLKVIKPEGSNPMSFETYLYLEKRTVPQRFFSKTSIRSELMDHYSPVVRFHKAARMYSDNMTEEDIITATAPQVTPKVVKRSYVDLKFLFYSLGQDNSSERDRRINSILAHHPPGSKLVKRFSSDISEIYISSNCYKLFKKSIRKFYFNLWMPHFELPQYCKGYVAKANLVDMIMNQDFNHIMIKKSCLINGSHHIPFVYDLNHPIMSWDSPDSYSFYEIEEPTFNIDHLVDGEDFTNWDWLNDIPDQDFNFKRVSEPKPEIPRYGGVQPEPSAPPMSPKVVSFATELISPPTPSIRSPDLALFRLSDQPSVTTKSEPEVKDMSIFTSGEKTQGIVKASDLSSGFRTPSENPIGIGSTINFGKHSLSTSFNKGFQNIYITQSFSSSTLKRYFDFQSSMMMSVKSGRDYDYIDVNQDRIYRATKPSHHLFDDVLHRCQDPVVNVYLDMSLSLNDFFHALYDYLSKSSLKKALNVVVDQISPFQIQIVDGSSERNILKANASFMARVNQTLDRVGKTSYWPVNVLSDGYCAFRAISLAKGKLQSEYSRDISLEPQINIKVNDLIALCRKINMPFLHINDEHEVVNTLDDSRNGIFFTETHACALILPGLHPLIDKPQIPLKLQEFELKIFPDGCTEKSVKDAYESAIKSLTSDKAYFGFTSDGSDKSHNVPVKKIDPIRTIHSDNAPKVVTCSVINGVPGSGKTEFLCKTIQPKSICITGSSQARAELKDRVRATLASKGDVNLRNFQSNYIFKTFAHAFNPTSQEKYQIPAHDIKTVYLDESYRMFRFQIYVLAWAFPHAKFVFLGDVDQTHGDESWVSSSPDRMTLNKLFLANNIDVRTHPAVSRMTVSSRFGASWVKTLSLLLPGYNPLLTMKSSHDEPFTFTASDHAPNGSLDWLRLSPTRVDYDVDPSDITVHAAQGLSRRRVILTINNGWQPKTFRDSAYVALTRATSFLHIVDPNNAYINDYNVKRALNGVGNVTGFNVHFQADTITNKGLDPILFEHFTSLMAGLSSKMPTRKIFTPYQPANHKSFIVNFDLALTRYVLSKHSLDIGCHEQMIFIASHAVPAKIKLHKMKILEDIVITPLGPPEGKRHESKSWFQEMHTIVGRLFTSKEILRYQNRRFSAVNMRQLAQDVKKRFFEVYVDQDMYKKTLETYEIVDEELSRAINEFSTVFKFAPSDQKMTLKGLVSDLHGFLKKQIKTKDLEATFANKGGQPIAAFSKFVNILYSVMFRSMTAIMKRCLKPNFLIANNCSEDTVNSFINEYFGDKFYAFEGDATNYDATQSERSRFLEMTTWSLFSFDDGALELYSLIRKNPYYRSGSLATNYGDGRPSGGPDTMCGNIILMMIIIVMMFKKDDILAGIFKGDDSSIKVSHPYITTDMTFFNMFFPVPLKIKVNQNTTEFCNYVYGFGTYLYNPNLFFGKVINKDFKRILSSHDEHAEYKEAVSIMVNPVRQKFDQCRKVIINHFKFGFEAATIVLQQMDAYARLQENQLRIKLDLRERRISDKLGVGNVLNNNNNGIQRVHTPTNAMSNQSDQQIIAELEQRLAEVKARFATTPKMFFDGNIGDAPMNAAFKKGFKDAVQVDLLPSKNKGDLNMPDFSSSDIASMVGTRQTLKTVFSPERQGLLITPQTNVAHFHDDQVMRVALMPTRPDKLCSGSLPYRTYMNITNSAGIWFCCDCQAANINKQTCGKCGNIVIDHDFNAFKIVSSVWYPSYGTKAKPMEKSKQQVPKMRSSKPKPKKQNKAQSKNKGSAVNNNMKREISEAEELANTLVSASTEGASPLRLYNRYGSVETAVGSITTSFEIEYANDAFVPAKIPKEENVMLKFFGSNVSNATVLKNMAGQVATYNGYGCNQNYGSDDVNATPNSLTWNLPVFSNGKAALVRPSFLSATTIFKPHGAKMCMFGLKGAFYANSADLLSVKVDSSTFPGAQITYLLYFITPGQTDQLALRINGQLGVPALLLNGDIPQGLYRVEIICNDASPLDVLDGVVTLWQQTVQGKDITAFQMIEGVFDFLPNMDTQRTTFAGLMGTNSAPEANRTGNLTAIQMEPGIDIKDFVTGSPYNKVRVMKDSTGVLDSSTGVFVPYRRNSDKADEWQEPTIKNESVGIQYTYAPYPWEFGFIVVVFYTPIPTTSIGITQAGRFTVWDSLEYTTTNQMIDVEITTMKRATYDAATDIVSRMPKYYSNSLHLSEIWRSIKKTASKIVNGIVDYAPAVFDVVQKYGPMVAKVLA